jgi:hypothetical protein
MTPRGKQREMVGSYAVDSGDDDVVVEREEYGETDRLSEGQVAEREKSS